MNREADLPVGLVLAQTLHLSDLPSDCPCICVSHYVARSAGGENNARQGGTSNACMFFMGQGKMRWNEGEKWAILLRAVAILPPPLHTVPSSLFFLPLESTIQGQYPRCLLGGAIA